MAEVKETISIGSKADTRGFKKAETAASRLNKNLKNLAGTFGAVYSTARVIQFGKASVNALVEAEKANTRLANSVKNLGLSFATATIQKNLDDISRSAGIAGEILVDAYQPLLTATGSVIQSQKMLNLALDVSAGSGVGLTTVTQDLANAYVGITRGLRKYNLGLTQAELKTISYEAVQAKLNKQFSGSQAAYLDTYAGKLQILGEAAGNAQERIGATLIDLGAAFTGSSNVEEFVTKIERLTDRFVGLMDRFTEGIAIIRAMLGAKTWTGMFRAAQEAQVAEFNRRMKRDYMKAWEGTNVPMSEQALAQQRAAEAAAKKRAEQIRKEQEKQTKELKKQSALKKAGTVFDREQIERIAALRGKLSDEDRKRIEAQLALLNGNDVLAQKLTREILMAQDATGGLYKYFLSIGDAKIKNPFEFLDKWILDFQAKLDALKFPTLSTTPSGSGAQGATGGGAGGGTSIVVGNNSLAVTNRDIPTNVGTPFGQAGSFVDSIGTPFGQARSFVDTMGTPFGQAGSIKVELVGNGDRLIDALAEGLQQKSLSTGDSSYINRRTGGFAG